MQNVMKTLKIGTTNLMVGFGAVCVGGKHFGVLIRTHEVREIYMFEYGVGRFEWCR